MSSVPGGADIISGVNSLLKGSGDLACAMGSTLWKNNFLSVAGAGALFALVRSKMAPLSVFSRVCFFDRTSYLGDYKALDSEKEKLFEKIQICKEKAGIRGGKYPPALTSWRKEVISLSQNVEKVKSQSPSQASPKNELVYNHDIAKAATDKEVEVLSKHVSTYTTLLLIHNYLGPGAQVDSNVIFDLIAQNERDPRVDVLSLYLAQFSQKMRWGFLQRSWLSVAYYLSAGIISSVIHTTFQNVLAEIRTSTDGKVESIFEGLLDHLEKFLKDYSGEKPLEDFIEKKNLPDLCKELSPYLVEEFFPKISFFKVMFKQLPFVRPLSWTLDATVGFVLNSGIRFLVKLYLPGVLQVLSETVESTVLKKFSEKEKEESPVNYRVAIPVVRFINEKLFAFATQLKQPPLDIDEPPPPRIAAKLGGVINELLKLSENPSNDEMILEGMRNGLIDGGYQLMKYWQSEQENLLQQVLVLTDLQFTESTEISDPEADKKELDALWKSQAKIVETLSDRLFEFEVKKYVGMPKRQVMHHLAKEHSRIKRYLEEGFSDVIGLRSCLQRAAVDIKKPNYQGLDEILNKHLVFWEGFLSLMKASTRKYYPKPASEVLMREFYPLCKDAVGQVDQVSSLQDEWVLYTRHKELKHYFHEISGLLDVRKSQDFNLAEIQKVINKIEILLPPNPPEVQILKRFVEAFTSLKNLEDSLKSWNSLKNEIKKYKQNIFGVEFEEVKFLLSRHPQIRKSSELISLSKKYLSLCGGETDLDGAAKAAVLRDILVQIENSIQEESQALRELQINLLHRIYPFKPVSSFVIPLSLGSLLKEVKAWSTMKKLGYEALESRNLKSLEKGIKKLETDVTALQKRVQKMRPHDLYFPLEYTLDKLTWACGDMSKVPFIRSKKEHLVQDLNAILAGITPLITAKKEAGKKNLYSWIERLALYETLKYFKSKEST